jgi:hypothetical protein
MRLRARRDVWQVLREDIYEPAELGAQGGYEVNGLPDDLKAAPGDEPADDALIEFDCWTEAAIDRAGRATCGLSKHSRFRVVHSDAESERVEGGVMQTVSITIERFVDDEDFAEVDPAMSSLACSLGHLGTGIQ